MLSGVLRGKRAVEVNVSIMRAFVRLRDLLVTNEELARKWIGDTRADDRSILPSAHAPAAMAQAGHAQSAITAGGLLSILASRRRYRAVLANVRCTSWRRLGLGRKRLFTPVAGGV
jgi:hypothetical protein